jgi:hypothetical protein
MTKQDVTESKAMAQVATAETQMMPADPMVSMIERVALDPSADLDKLERMLAMKERMEAQASRQAFNEALAEAQAEMPTVAAKHKNDQTKSKYAKLSDIYEECKPIAAKHGFSFNAVPVSGGADGFMDMKWTLRRGASVESDVSPVPLDDKGMKGTSNKTQTHAYGSTTSYGRRYLFCAVFDIAIGEDNDGNKSMKPVDTLSEEQYRELRDLLDESGMPEVKFNLAFGHKDPENADLHLFPANLFDEAKNRLVAFKARKGETANA